MQSRDCQTKLKFGGNFLVTPVVANENNGSSRKGKIAQWHRSCGLDWLGPVWSEVRFAYK